MRLVLILAWAAFGLLSPDGTRAESLLSNTYAAAWVSPGFPPAGPVAFVLGEVRDDTGREASFDIAAHVRDGLRSRLLAEGFRESAPPGDPDAVRIDVSLRLFQEGGAFGRWVTLSGGAGAAYVIGHARLGRAGRAAGAELIAASVIARGGLYSVGAEKTVLTDFAERIAGMLKAAEAVDAQPAAAAHPPPVPLPSTAEMTPERLAADVRIPIGVRVANVELARTAREVEAPFDAVAGAFPFTRAKAEALVDLRNAVRMTLAAAGASTEPEAPGAPYVLTPIVLGGMTIPFREAYAFLFMRYELAGADGAKLWSINVYSQAKLDTHATDAWRKPEVQTAYARLAAANLRQMAAALSGWTATAAR